MKLPYVFAIQMIIPAAVAADVPKAKAVDGKDPVMLVPDVLTAGLARVHSVPPDTFFERHVVGDETGRVAVGVERRIYSNTGGTWFVALGGGRPVADDITTTAPNDTLLGRYTFQVTGKANSEGQGGPYSVEFALYNQCPQSVVLADRPGLVIPGTVGTASFPDDAPRQIEFVVPDDVTVRLPTNFFLAVELSHDNVGILMGAPALEGHSDDNWDFPPFPCASFLGGFPDLPHASFNIEVFDREDSVETHVEYKARRLSGPTFNPGDDVWLVDDLQLLTPNCEMVAYEVAIKGQARYDFEFRSSCDSGSISGTTRALNNSQNGLRLLRVSFPEPVALPRNPWFAVRVGNLVGGTVVAGTQPTIGDSANFFGTIDAEGACRLQTAGTGVYAALHLTVTCAGPAPLGACCDMFLGQCEGGPDDGRACQFAPECETCPLIVSCAEPGLCQIVCRDVPQINCSFPPPDTELEPRWREGESCDADPFPFPCGVAACCKPDDTCENLTENECMALEPLDRPRQWQLGRFCNVDNQACPIIVCLIRQGECTLPREDTGCESPDCCTAVCKFDPFCCTTAWDDLCARWGVELCGIPPSNDHCWTGSTDRHARAIEVGQTIVSYLHTATENEGDPIVCCHNRLPTECLDGPFLGRLCYNFKNCHGETCGAAPQVGANTVWFKFVANDTSVRLSTCDSESGSTDSLLQVLAVGDDTSEETACSTLSTIGCNDNGCDTGLNSDLCVEGLTPGETYYVLLSTKRNHPLGDPGDNAYSLSITSPCTTLASPPVSDSCWLATTVDNTNCDGCNAIAIDLTIATLECPAPLVAPDMEADRWLEYTATCSGLVRIDTCGSGFDTNLLVYDGCGDCPDHKTVPIAWNGDSSVCGAGSNESHVEFNVAKGQCLRIRVGNELGSSGTGRLNIECPAECPIGSTTDANPSGGTFDTRRPHQQDANALVFGISNVLVTTSGVTVPTCWNLCETNVFKTPNAVESVVEEQPGRYRVTFARPITPGAATTLSYAGESTPSPLTYIYHPANINLDGVSDANDITDTVSLLVNLPNPFIPLVRMDCDHSGSFGVLDLLCIIDLLNEGWNGTSLPSVQDGCAK